jgi:N-methylhydantoinase B
MSLDKFTSDIIQDSLIAIGEAMFETIQRTSMSPIIWSIRLCSGNNRRER